MRRTILFLTLGVFSTALLVSMFSVYILHDVDQAMVGHLTQAFEGLCAEGGVFALVIGALTGVLTAIGGFFLRRRSFEPRSALGISLGVCFTACQYPLDIMSRKLFPQYADFALGSYPVIASILCAAILLRASLSPGIPDNILGESDQSS